MSLFELDTTGFLFTEVACDWNVLSADFGDGFESAVLVGAPEGTRTWSIRIDAFLDEPIGGISRAQYLWQFFRESKAAGNQPFQVEMEDPDDGQRKLFLASFVDNRLSYSILCAKVYSTGLQLRQRRDLTQPPYIPALSPANIEGVRAWGMADEITGNDGDLISSAPELAGTGAIISQSDIARRPTLKIESGVRMLRSPGLTGLIISNLTQFDTAHCTLVAVGRGTANIYGNPFKVLMSPDNAQHQDVPLLGRENASQVWGGISGNGWMFNTSKTSHATRFDFMAFAAERYSSNKGCLMVLNGNVFFRQQSQRGRDVTEEYLGRLSTEAYVGGWGDGSTWSWEGDYRAWALFNRPLAELEMLGLWKHFSTTLNLTAFQKPSELWVFDGDSMTTGLLRTSANGDIAYPERVLATRTSVVKSYNVAILGQTLAQMLADQTSQVLPLFVANSILARKTLIVWSGTNDIHFGATPSAVYANLLSYVQNARAVSPDLPVIVLTMLPREASGTVETNRLAYNTLIRNGAVANNLTLADVANDADIGAPGSQNDTDFYDTDTIHLTDAGNEIVAGYVIAAISSLY